MNNSSKMENWFLKSWQYKTYTWFVASLLRSENLSTKEMFLEFQFWKKYTKSNTVIMPRNRREGATSPFGSVLTKSISTEELREYFECPVCFNVIWLHLFLNCTFWFQILLYYLRFPGPEARYSPVHKDICYATNVGAESTSVQFVAFQSQKKIKCDCILLKDF